jgi:phosphatidate cytidylyltransferase
MSEEVKKEGVISSSMTRIKTGIVLILFVLGLGYFDSYPIMWLFLGITMMIATKESLDLFGIESRVSVYFYSLIIWLVAYKYPNPQDLVFVIAIILGSILAYTKKLNKNLFIPLLYPIVSFLFLLILYKEFGILSMLWLLVVVAGADIGAYFTGKSIGKTQFCATSPNKTIEGVVGGLVFASVLGAIFSTTTFFTGLVISFLVAIASVYGDLFESYLKREAGIKDSGDILPGHGGVLDRTDGYLFGGVILFVALRLL